MITSAQAYAAGPDGRVDTSEGSLFRQYMAQQDAAKAAIGPGSAFANSLTPEQQYMQANPDVLNQISAMQSALEPGASNAVKDNRAALAARQHFIDYGQTEGRDSFGMPLSGFTTGGQPANTIPVQTQPFNPVMPDVQIQPDPNNIAGGSPSMPPQNFTAPIPGQLPGYDFVGDVNRYANEIGNFGGLLANTNPFYAGQVPGPATQANPQTGGYNAPELSMYPNANYAAGAFPIIFTS